MRPSSWLSASLLLLLGAALSNAADTNNLRRSSSAVGYHGYAQEPRLQLEADVPLGAIGRGRRFVVQGRVTEQDALDLQFVLRHDSAAVEALHEVRGRVWCEVSCRVCPR